MRSQEDFKTAMRHWCNDITTDLREQASRRIASLAAYSEIHFKRIREQHDRQFQQELTDLESMHDGHISDAMENNKQEVHRMRNSWKMAINDNLDSILQLRKDVKVLKEEDRRTRINLRGMHNQNENIIVPLKSKRTSLQQLNSDLESHNEQKQDINTKKQKLRCAEEELKEIKWNNEVLFQRVDALKNDYLAQKKNFHNSIYSAQQQSNFHNLLLEEKIRKLSKNGATSIAAITEILQRANISLDTIHNNEVPITDVVKNDRDRVKILQEKLKSVTVAHSAMMKRSQELSEKYGKEI